LEAFPSWFSGLPGVEEAPDLIIRGLGGETVSDEYLAALNLRFSEDLIE
jgi:hypothetical protein